MIFLYQKIENFTRAMLFKPERKYKEMRLKKKRKTIPNAV